MTRVLYLPLNSQEITQTGMYDAFRKAQVELEIFDFMMQRDANSKLISRALAFRPHLIHMQLQFSNIISPNTIATIKRSLPDVIITNWTGDVRAAVQDVFVKMAKVVDISLVSSVGQVNMYKNASQRDVRYWQIGVDPKKYFPKYCQEFLYDVSFAANNHVASGFPGASERKQAVSLLHRAFGKRFGLFGAGWRVQSKYVPQIKMNDIYNNSLSCLSISNFNKLSHYFSDRLLMCMASGRPTISMHFPGWESYFTNNHDIVIADSLSEIPKKVTWLKNNPEIATSIGRNGAAKVLAEHSYYCRVKELLYMTGFR